MIELDYVFVLLHFYNCRLTFFSFPISVRYSPYLFCSLITFYLKFFFQLIVKHLIEADPESSVKVDASYKFHYPTLCHTCRIQIMHETSTNITWYLYLSYSPDLAKAKKLDRSEFRQKKMLDNKSLIRHFSV